MPQTSVSKTSEPHHPTVTLAAWQVAEIKFPDDGETLGGGGLGTVSAVTVSFPAAVKVPHDSDEARADMADEVAALKAIGQHDNIVELYAWGYAPEKECDVLLMERAQGCLHSLIRWADPPAAI